MSIPQHTGMGLTMKDGRQGRGRIRSPKPIAGYCLSYLQRVDLSVIPVEVDPEKVIGFEAHAWSNLWSKMVGDSMVSAG